MQLASVVDRTSIQTNKQVKDIKAQQANEKAFSDVFELEKGTTNIPKKNVTDERAIKKDTKLEIGKKEEKGTKTEADIDIEDTDETTPSDNLLPLIEELIVIQSVPKETITGKFKGQELLGQGDQEADINEIKINGEKWTDVSNLGNKRVKSTLPTLDLFNNETVAHGNSDIQLKGASLDNKETSLIMPTTEVLENNTITNEEGALLNQLGLETKGNVKGTVQESQILQDTGAQPSIIQSMNSEEQMGEGIESNSQTEEFKQPSTVLEQRIQVVDQKNNSVNSFLGDAKTMPEVISELENVDMLMSMGQATQVEMKSNQVEFVNEVVFAESIQQSTDIIQQVVEKIDFIQLQSSEMMKVQLKPDYLGEITISLERSNDGMTASILTSNAQVREALAGQIGQLTSNLSDYGIKPDHIEIVFTEQGNYTGQESQGEAMSFNNQTPNSQQMSQWVVDSEQLDELEQGVIIPAMEQNESIHYGRINRYA